MKELLMRCKRKTNKKLWIVISCRWIEKCTVKNEKQKANKHEKTNRTTLYNLFYLTAFCSR